MNPGKNDPDEPQLRDDRYLIKQDDLAAQDASGSALELSFDVVHSGVWIGRSLIAPIIIIISLILWKYLSIRTKRRMLDVRSLQVAMPLT